MRIPTATYRIQFHQEFTFEAMQAIVDYLVALGISDVYASPIFKARGGSTHGYDVVDPTQLNPEIGTSEQFDQLIQSLQQHQIGWLQDIVPNHMAYDSENHYLMDILENGPDSEFIDFFDIEWNHAYESFKGKVLAPLLGNFYGNCLENSEIQLQYDESGLSIHYYNLRLPVRIESYLLLITHNLGQLTKLLGRKNPDFIKLLGMLYLIKSIPVETKGRERDDQIAFVKGLLWELYTQNLDIQAFFNANIQTFNGIAGEPASFTYLEQLLSDQFYRLSFWKVGAEEINYRRFFTVNELISVKVEEVKVFHKTHALIFDWVESGKVTGIRIDHIDGLYNPSQYLEDLQAKVAGTYITVEKILELNEDLPDQWQIQGTSGYESLNYINGLFCQAQHETEILEVYRRFTGQRVDYEALAAEKKRLIVEKNLAGDVDNLAQRLKNIAGHTRQGSDFTAYGLKRSLTEVLALFPVYRTYINSDQVSDCDRAMIQIAVEKAKTAVPQLINELNYIEKLLLRQDEATLTEEQKQERLHFVMKFQQLTGPLMAKGVEDTTLYIYCPLLALNEVGGNPGHFGITSEQFHQFNQKKSDRWMHSMNATATHDTKRGEDARTRLNVLSEIPAEWEKQISTWSQLNQGKKTQANGQSIPDQNDEYFLYQTLLGAYPDSEAEYPEFVQRIKNYVTKAVREAKVHTAWLRPDSTYEEGYLTFVEKILDSAQENNFLQEFRSFQQQVAEYGMFNSLSQVLLKYAMPGVPDLYQGCELWDLSLVDPDNRRPVDYPQRYSMLDEMQQQVQINCLELVQKLLAMKADGRVKLFLTYRMLQARKNHWQIFQKGSYHPLQTSGKFSDHVIAFARVYENKAAIAIAPRFLTSVVQPGELPLGEVWQDTQVHLPNDLSNHWHNTITEQLIQGKNLAIKQVFQHFPGALLVSQEDH